LLSSQKTLFVTMSPEHDYPPLRASPAGRAACPKGAAWQLEDHHFHRCLRHDRVTAPFVLEGPMTGEMFKAYTEQFLAPTLTRGDIVFMDDVSVHKVDGVEEAIEARGAIPLYLPHTALI
jgi:hypothetical protein